MKRMLLPAATTVLAAWGAWTAAGAETARRSNVVILLADDLGYSDVGCYGSEIETPNLDALGQDGLRFTPFHNTGRCWPTRASLLAGYYAQRDAGFEGLDERAAPTRHVHGSHPHER